MKKLIALAAVVAAVSFASCGNKSTSDAQADSIRKADSIRMVDSLRMVNAADSLKAAAMNDQAVDSLKAAVEGAATTVEKVAEKATEAVKK